MENATEERPPKAAAKDFATAIALGLAGSAVGALVWVMISAAMHCLESAASVSVGFAAGLGVFFATQERRRSIALGLTAAACAAPGILLGAIGSVCLFTASQNAESIFSLVTRVPFARLGSLVANSFGWGDIAFMASAAAAACLIAMARPKKRERHAHARLPLGQRLIVGLAEAAQSNTGSFCPDADTTGEEAIDMIAQPKRRRRKGATVYSIPGAPANATPKSARKSAAPRARAQDDEEDDAPPPKARRPRKTVSSDEDAPAPRRKTKNRRDRETHE
ncbi:MAG TPA: hypothetical protein PLO62_07330 [Candidatus Hydrogenedentes bacterium]|nr:hypothetical protein [Candidatus Hydrogenedentota bacterium]HOS02071.1 hypothetical protein [Candidatus Hydrogenedentota bacterium]